MLDVESGEESFCPYCDSAAECPHMLALIDRTFGGCGAGYCFDRYDEFGKLVEAAFLGRLQSGTARDHSWNHAELNELWKYAFDNHSTGNQFVVLDGGVLTRLVIELLDGAADEQHDLIEDGGFPGSSSALTLYYAENTAEALDEALAKLRNILKPVERAISSQSEKRLVYPFASTVKPGTNATNRRATCQELMAKLEELGCKTLPLDHPIFAEGPSITFLPHERGQSVEKDPGGLRNACCVGDKRRSS